MDRLKDKLKEYYGKGEVREWVKQLQNIAKKKSAELIAPPFGSEQKKSESGIERL